MITKSADGFRVVFRKDFKIFSLIALVLGCAVCIAFIITYYEKAASPLEFAKEVIVPTVIGGIVLLFLAFFSSFLCALSKHGNIRKTLSRIIGTLIASPFSFARIIVDDLRCKYLLSKAWEERNKNSEL
ncbi:MAG: hypothetical protein AAGA18_09905 [Verrucomicrobiota bacterium]